MAVKERIIILDHFPEIELNDKNRDLLEAEAKQVALDALSECGFSVDRFDISTEAKSVVGVDVTIREKETSGEADKSSLSFYFILPMKNQ